MLGVARIYKTSGGETHHLSHWQAFNLRHHVRHVETAAEGQIVRTVNYYDPSIEAVVKLPLTLAYMVGCLKASRRANGAMLENEIAELDAVNGDPDIELNGDERDGSMGADDFCLHKVPLTLQGAGCPVSDPDTVLDNSSCDEPHQDLDHEDAH